MKLIQTVTVKQVLTEVSKQKLLNKYEALKFQLNKECDQLRFEMKKLEKTNKFQVSSLKKQFEQEIASRSEKAKLIDFQIEQLHMLPLGSELKEKEVQALVEVKVGDSWDEIDKESAIIIKDGIIEEIR